MEVFHDVAVDKRVEEADDPGRRQRGFRILTRRDDGNLDAEYSKLFHQRYRSVVDGDTLGPHHLEDEVVLSVTESLDRSCVGWIAVGALGKLDSSRREEIAHTVLARFSVDVLLVVALDVEGRVRGACALRLLQKERVEGLFPGFGVDQRRLGQYSVHVEETRRERMEVDGGGIVRAWRLTHGYSSVSYTH